jgi:hypothetical protein
MKMVGSITQLTEDHPDRVNRPRMTEPWAADFLNLRAAIQSLARGEAVLKEELKELREEVKAMKGQL